MAAPGQPDPCSPHAHFLAQDAFALPGDPLTFLDLNLCSGLPPPGSLPAGLPPLAGVQGQYGVNLVPMPVNVPVAVPGMGILPLPRFGLEPLAGYGSSSSGGTGGNEGIEENHAGQAAADRPAADGGALHLASQLGAAAGQAQPLFQLQYQRLLLMQQQQQQQQQRAEEAAQRDLAEWQAQAGGVKSEQTQATLAGALLMPGELMSWPQAHAQEGHSYSDSHHHRPSGSLSAAATAAGPGKAAPHGVHVGEEAPALAPDVMGVSLRPRTRSMSQQEAELAAAAAAEGGAHGTGGGVAAAMAAAAAAGQAGGPAAVEDDAESEGEDAERGQRKRKRGRWTPKSPRSSARPRRRIAAPGTAADGEEEVEVEGDGQGDGGRKERTSKFRGVTKHRRSGRFEAHIWVKELGRQLYLGGYEQEEHAAEAYDIAALKCKGRRVRTNFPLDKYTDLLGCIDRMSVEELVMAVRRQSQGFSRGSSSYRGVTHHPSGRYEARIGVPGSKHVYLGLFPEEADAARAYDRALVRLRGAGASTNFTLSDYRAEMSDYHTWQSRTLKGCARAAEICDTPELFERWLKSGVEAFSGLAGGAQAAGVVPAQVGAQQQAPKQDGQVQQAQQD